MAIVLEPYSERHTGAVREFNRRISHLVEDGLIFPESPLAAWLPIGSHPLIYQQGWVACEENDVRGGYFLKHQPFAVSGVIDQVPSYRIPLSEGISSRAYASLGLRMLRHALAQHPRLFSLGMGSLDRPLPKMQKAMGWSQHVVPFYFKVIHGGNFLRNIAPLRDTAIKRAFLDLAASTGLGSLGLRAFHLLRGGNPTRGVSLEAIDEFGAWTDELWERSKELYSIIAVRDRDIANFLYPRSDPRFLRWKVTRGEGGSLKTLGWVICLDTRMQAHKQFGNMRVGTIVDGLADPEDAGVVLGSAARELERRGVDLIVSNQLHPKWGDALLANGFLNGPSNYIFSASPKLSESLAPFTTHVLEGHINRGDGDGPIHL